MSTVIPSVSPGVVSPRRPVPAHIARPEYVDKPSPAKFEGSEVKDAETIEKMRFAGRLARVAVRLRAVLERFLDAEAAQG